MKSTCLSLCKQGWFGVPLFFLGIASLAFSQLVQEAEIESLPPDQQVQFIESKLKDLNSRVKVVQNGQGGDSFALKRQSSIGNLEQLISVYGKNDSNALSIQEMINQADQTWKSRSNEINQGASSVVSRLNEANLILDDLSENFAGRLDEAAPALNVLRENLVRTETEVEALSKLSKNAISDANNAFSIIQTESNRLAVKAVPTIPKNSPPTNNYSPVAKQVANVINAKEAVPLSGSSRFSPSINTDAGLVKERGEENLNRDSSEIINRLKSELAVSKSVQNELSADTSDLQGDLRKAYREIVSLQANLKETQMLARELEQSKNSLWQNESGGRATAQSVSGKINRLESELQLAREDLRSSRQTLLLEQERSNSMLRSVTNELERTRKDLDSARTATTTSKTDSMRLASLERELNQTRRALQMAQMAPMDSTKESYLALQDELRKALGEITRMQVELNEKDELEAQLVKLRSSMEEFGDSPSRSASPEYVNKLLIDLNAAKSEVEKAKSLNRAGRQDLVERVASLENELKISSIALKKTQAEFDASQEKIARREFEYASTIQRLEEDAQMAQNSLRDASLGKLPAIPFVDEMERNLADSEARIQTLSARFEAEQSKATELIEGLQVELDAAVVRQKRALDQLAKREIELEGKDLELKQAKEDTKKHKEELEVVKVIAGQLEDLNTVLEQTKRTQNSQSGTLDQTVASLREELNQAKVELVFALEDNEKFKQDSAKIISSLELQLENTRNDLLAEQENQADQANESKELVLDLKSELDLARSEISRMKTAGLGDSVETKQAVSQLQEALGTIRILQESLEQSEKVNLEVDNLRTELANTMESQLLELQRADDEKNVLRKQSEDLESEIALLRNQGLGAGVQFQKSNAALMEELEVSKLRIVELEKRAAMTEDGEVLSLIDLEEELASEKLRNQELQQELSQKVIGKTKTVELLESELADALKKLDDIELQENAREEKIANLEKEISQAKLLIESNPKNEPTMDANQIAMVSQLEEQLMEAQNRLSKLENMPEDSTIDEGQDSEAIQKLENDLVQAEQTIAALQVSLDSQDKRRNDLQVQLDEAVDKLNQLAQVPNPSTVKEKSSELSDAEDFIRMENELLAAQKTIDELIAKTKSEELDRVNLENKLAMAIKNIDKIENNRPPVSPIEPLNNDSAVVEELKSLLDSKDKRLNELEEELSNAIVEMTEKEAELEIAAGIQEDMEILANKLANAEKSLAEIDTNQIVEPKDSTVSPITDSERDALEAEINQLKTELLAARTESPSSSQDNKILLELQQQLQDAVAESVEMQTELEETKSRLSLIESTPQNESRSSELDKILVNAKEAEDQAMLRIGNLTTALRNSEELRKEMEALLVEADQQPKTVVESPNLASDPRFIELQKELLLLQQDLLSAREIEEPRVEALQMKLDASQNDSLRLNDEFKKAMQDFANFKEQVAILEEENRRLQKIASSPVSNQDREMRASLQNRVNDLSKENANLRMQVGERDNRVSGLREELARAQMTVPGIKPDNASLRAQIVRLEGTAQVARDGETRAKMEAQRSLGEVQALNQKVILLEESLRQAQSQSRGVPSSLPSYIPPQVVVSNAADGAEILRLREQNQRLQSQLLASNTVPQRDQLDRKVRDLNQKNLTAQIQLDQERARVEDLRRQLADARDIKQEVVERGQSANMKVGLLNNELSDAQNRIASLENALVAAREAIRVLKKGGSGSSTMKVSIPNSSRRSSFYNPSSSPMSVTPSTRPLPRTYSTPRTLPSPSFRSSSSPINRILPNSSLTSPGVQKIPEGDASIQLRAQVQFLNNKNRPAGFSEFFLVKNDLESLLSNSRIRIPAGQGIDSGAELWARSVQRGYRFPGVASAIRNALATNSLARIKTNSMGEANLDNIEAGNYYIVGSSPLGQVGVVWSKEVQLKPGTNGVVLDLRDATWAE